MKKEYRMRFDYMYIKSNTYMTEMKDLKIKSKLSFNLIGICLKVSHQTLHPERLFFQLKVICFVSTIFSLRKQGIPHQTFPC